MSAELQSRFDGEFQDGELMNGNVPLFNKDSSENVPVKEGRVIRKAKRVGKTSPQKEENAMNGMTSSVPQPIHGKKPLPFTKNSRKSRNARGRGLPKGGAGGKGTWGKPGSEIDGLDRTDDVKDPNYDSDSQGDYVVKVLTPELKEEELQRSLQPILQEYLEHGDSEEVATLLHDLNMGSHVYKVPELAVSLAMDRHDPHREMTSRLISDLSGDVITQEELARGFDELLTNIKDLTLDTPDAPTILGQFIARAVADECLPKDFPTQYKGKVHCDLVRQAVEKTEVLLFVTVGCRANGHRQYSRGLENAPVSNSQALEKAEVLLSVNRSMLQLDNVWGVGGGTRPVRFLVSKVDLLLRELLNSGEVEEAVHCLKELDVPHFHHELVYQTAVIAMEDSTVRAADLMVSLLKSLTTTCVVTPDQFTKGFKRVYAEMPDLCLDVPAAYSLLERLGNKMEEAGILSEELAKEMPNSPFQGRKRFVSEGDGGKLKAANGIH